MINAAILQLNASDDPQANVDQTLAYLHRAVAAGAEFILTPEVTNCVSTSRSHQHAVLQHQEDDLTLAALRQAAAEAQIWLLIGSLGIKTHDADGRFANRCFLIGPEGQIVAQYDKIHMFDVQINETETYRESAGYRPGDRAVVAETPFGTLGLSICYDLRFPLLYNALANAGAQIITVPAAFSPVTGAAHWHALLRARAIETGCFVIAPAQTGTHASASHKTRDCYGHSLVVSPWGEVILDAGVEPGVYNFNLEMDDVAAARQKVPSLSNARAFDGPLSGI